jgi:2-polyprenyl-3-methyl-5-hydroxy-6-metoxy-1,4-benzoquinol methylase
MNFAVCPLCSKQAAFYFGKFSDMYYRCSCGFVFIWPRPSDEYLQELYRKHGEEYWTDERMVKFTLSPSNKRREITFVRRFASSGTLLDIGCSTGSFVRAARDAGFVAEGVDISAPAVACGVKCGLPLRCLDVLNDSIPVKFDIVTMWATLEHLPEPKRHLKRAKELLKPGGLLFVSVPNYSGISQKIIGKWDRYVGTDHLNYFTPAVLRSTVEHAGMDHRSTTTFGFNPIVLFRDWRNRGTSNLTVEDMQVDQASSLSMKESSLRHVQRVIEYALDIFSLGDAVAVCARSPHK